MRDRGRRGGGPRGAALGAAILLALLAAGGAPLFAQSPEEIFNRANRAYDEGRYEEAARAYESLLRYRIEDPRLEYNLGNAEFRLGNLGRAILHYERARRLDPTDPDIRANLDYARSLRVDRVPPPEIAAPLRWIRGVQDRLGPDLQVWLVLGALWLVCGLLAWGLSAPGRWHAGHGWVLASLLVLFAVLAGSWYMTYRRLEGREVAIVLERQVEVLAGPGENNATLATVHEGLDVEVRGEREEWVQVRLPRGVSGWVSRRSVGFV